MRIWGIIRVQEVQEVQEVQRVQGVQKVQRFRGSEFRGEARAWRM